MSFVLDVVSIALSEIVMFTASNMTHPNVCFMLFELIARVNQLVKVHIKVSLSKQNDVMRNDRDNMSEISMNDRQ